MSRKALVTIIVVLVVALVAVTSTSVVSRNRLTRQLNAAQRDHEQYRARTTRFMKSSKHFSASPGWAARPHVEVVAKDGASGCFDCHTESTCVQCHEKPRSQSQTHDPQQVPDDVNVLVGRFRERGRECTVTSGGTQDWLFSGVPAATLSVDGGSVSAWQFPTEKAATDALANIGWDGTILKQMGESSMGMKDGADYPAPPHYYSSGRLVILYFAVKADTQTGRDKMVLKALSSVLGTQSAGQ